MTAIALSGAGTLTVFGPVQKAVALGGSGSLAASGVAYFPFHGWTADESQQCNVDLIGTATLDVTVPATSFTDQPVAPVVTRNIAMADPELDDNMRPTNWDGPTYA